VRIRVARRADHSFAPQRVQSAQPRRGCAEMAWTIPQAGQPTSCSELMLIFREQRRLVGFHCGEEEV